MCGRGERVCNGVSFACTTSSCGEKGRESLTWDSERTRPKHTPSCRTLKQLPSICHDLNSSGCNQNPLRPSNDDPPGPRREDLPLSDHIEIHWI